jgi:two-component system, NtrC family, response regulator AtoC
MSQAPPRILIVEDDGDYLDLYSRCLRGTNYEIHTTRKLSNALHLLETEHFDVVLTDLKMFGGAEEFSGFGVLERARKLDPEIQVIVITGYGSANHALRAMGSGAYDYITKDGELRRKLPLTVKSALEVRWLKRDMLNDSSGDVNPSEVTPIIGNSTSMQQVFEQISIAAQVKTNLLISGEEGTGKRLIAQTIHRLNHRKGDPFVVIDCGSLSDVSLASDFYGYESGIRYPGSKMQAGKLEQAAGGTLYFDCVNYLNPHFQAVLLTILSDGYVTRTGGQKPIKIQARVITSISADLMDLVEGGQFRRGLFDILNETSIYVPPLRDRKDGDDILALAAKFLQQYSTNSQVVFSAEAVIMLNRYNYPGNVRELASIVKEALVNCSGGIIKPDHLRREVREYKPDKRNIRIEAASKTSQSSIKPSPSLQRVRLSRLHQLISQGFNDSELRTLCLDLDIYYDDLPDEGRTNKARELVQLMQRQNRVTELVEICRRLRPNVEW